MGNGNLMAIEVFHVECCATVRGAATSAPKSWLNQIHREQEDAPGVLPNWECTGPGKLTVYRQRTRTPFQQIR